MYMNNLLTLETFRGNFCVLRRSGATPPPRPPAPPPPPRAGTRGGGSSSCIVPPAYICNMGGRYDNPFPTRFLAPIDCSKKSAHAGSTVYLLPSERCAFQATYSIYRSYVQNLPTLFTEAVC